jgi:hypothetical protein
MSSSDSECHLDDDALLAAGELRCRLLPAKHAAETVSRGGA